MAYDKKNYVITTAQRGGIPNWNFLESLVTYCKHNNAELIILPTNGMYPSSTKQDQEEVLDSYLQNNFKIVDYDMKLNNKIAIRNFPVKAQQIIPLTSWGRFVQYDQSAIMPSPKLMQKCYANSNQDLPKVLMSTGAITEPHYKENSWGKKAELDHKYAAIVVNVIDGRKYHFRQLVSTDKGVFYDIGVKYDGKNKPAKESLEAMILGDTHVGFTDPDVQKATEQLILRLNPKNILYHDICDAYSINHHHENDLVIQSRKANKNIDSLEEEVMSVGEYLKYMSKLSPDSKHVVVKSNHDEAIDRYIKEGRFIKDRKNMTFAMKLFDNAVKEQKDTLQYAIELAIGKLPKNIVFLSSDVDFKVKDWQLANHGHRGPNGARGNPRNLEGAVGRGIFGHFHSPEIFRDIWVVGTSTYLDLEYNKGFPSNWLQTHALLHPNGKPQLINIIEGTYEG